MKNFINDLVFGKSNKISGTIAIVVVALIALGCTCGKNFDLSNLQTDANSSQPSSNSNQKTTETTRATSDDELPANSELQALVKETTEDFAEAVENDDFSELYSKASSDFQSQYTEAEIKNVFKTFTEKKDVVSPILNKTSQVDAEFSPAPSLRTEKGLKILVTDGSFPTKPYEVKFEYEYIWRDGAWKLLKILVKM
ncbi:MAG: hypothetical protein JWN60_2147 [Acidobacteria bacterium]|jgi:hypothetical protein|nr:hypothetical protein [Acidobacteriota bacterium]